MKDSTKGKIALSVIFGLAIVGSVAQYKAEKFVSENRQSIVNLINKTSTPLPKTVK